MKIRLWILIFNDVCFTLQAQQNWRFISHTPKNVIKHFLEIIVIIGYLSPLGARKRSRYFTFG